jgi:anti-sigma factor RsiW
MDCKEVKAKLLDVVEAELPWEIEARVREHLACCPECREEFERLDRGASALSEALGVLAPARVHRTPERIERLTSACEAARKTVRLMTWRRFVACSAAAAILVSVGFLVGDVRRMQAPSEDDAGALVAQYDWQPSANVPVVLAATEHGEPIREIRPYAEAAAGDAPGGAVQWRPKLVRLDSAGFRVPVDHAFYDPRESSYWW